MSKKCLHWDDFFLTCYLASSVILRWLVMQFFRFLCVGGAGFVVDWSVFSTLLANSSTPFFARLIAFWCAVMTTWLGNRFFTFTQAQRVRVISQLSKHILISHLFGVVNLGVFWLFLPLTNVHVAFALGILLATAGNFLLSKRWVYKPC
ncbi:GtrA family protein [Pseudoalteromonas sp. S4498]|nr:GtrA family protein [Pseudoalteromonas galatheae]RXE86319.1 GtrA family protein [Pseudoalteromonas sp. A757]